MTTGPDAGPGSGAPDPEIGDLEERSLTRRLRDRRVMVEAKLAETRDRLEGARGTNTIIDTMFRALERDVATGGGVLSAAVAFRIFLFLVPFVFFLVVAFGYASEAAEGSPTALARSSGITGLIAGAISGAGHLSTTQRVSALLVSGFTLFWGVRAVVKVLRISHGLIWRVPIPRLRSASRAGGTFVGLVTVSLLSGLGVSLLREQSFVLGVLGMVISAVVPFGVWLLASYLLPHADCPWWALLPGAVIVSVGTVGLHAVTVYWFAYEVKAKSDTYGAIGVSLALLVWAYLLGRIITAAAAANAAFWYRREERAGHAVPPPVDLEHDLNRIVEDLHAEDG